MAYSYSSDRHNMPGTIFVLKHKQICWRSFRFKLARLYLRRATSVSVNWRPDQAKGLNIFDDRVRWSSLMYTRLSGTKIELANQRSVFLQGGFSL